MLFKSVSIDQVASRSNSIFTIHPYKNRGQWMFDDVRVGLIEEPFVAGMDDIIERAVAGINNADKGFTLLFSATPFPAYQIVLTLIRPEMGGNWYHAEELNMDGWLCPALFKYFVNAPYKLYIQVKPKPHP